VTPSRVVNVGGFFEASGYNLEKAAAQAAGAGFVRSEATSEEELITDCAGARIVLIESSTTCVTRRVVEHLSDCLMIGRTGTGFDNVDVAAATEKGIVVCNAAAYCSEEVSDHTVALILACARRIVLLDRRVVSGAWGDAELAAGMRRIKSQTVGLLGFGRIARLVTRKLSGFGLRVTASDPLVPASEAASYSVEMLALDQMLAEADYVSVHAPLTASTRHLLNANRLRRMKSSAYVINTSRGVLINEADLVVALREKWIAGAALDVTSIEPLPADSPLRELPNVILTPHFGAESSDANDELQQSTARSIAAVLQGYWPEFPVNPQVRPREPLRPWTEFVNHWDEDC